MDIPVDAAEPSSVRNDARLARYAEQAADSALAAGVKALVSEGRVDEARERFSTLVARTQRRALRIAWHFLRDSGEAEEAVQEAFIRIFTRIDTYREEYPFEVWFTRILINGCLDRQKANRRRLKWLVPDSEAAADGAAATAEASAPSPEDKLISRERRSEIWKAIERLPGRQRTVVSLCLLDELSPREVSLLTGMNQSTVRVHLFRALRRLRTLLGGLK
ncbi:MAG: RNA polymerase sigma factor [Vicinamibacterales bacterium]